MALAKTSDTDRKYFQAYSLILELRSLGHKVLITDKILRFVPFPPARMVKDLTYHQARITRILKQEDHNNFQEFLKRFNDSRNKP